MKVDIIIDQETQKVKFILDWKAEIVGQNLTADEAENVVKLIEEASRKASRKAFEQWLMQFECHTDVSVIGGKSYRFMMSLLPQNCCGEKIPHKIRNHHRVTQNFPTGQRRPNDFDTLQHRKIQPVASLLGGIQTTRKITPIDASCVK